MEVILKKFIGKQLKKQGRSRGKITVRRRGGGLKNYVRLVEDMSMFPGVPYKVLNIVKYGTLNKSVALVLYSNGVYSQKYVTDLVKESDVLIMQDGEFYSKGINSMGSDIDIETTNIGDKVSSIEGYPGGGFKYCLSNGSYGVVVKKISYLGGVFVKMRSGHVKFFYNGCRCILGVCAGGYKKYIYYYKAGQKRLLGCRPKVRGVAMNPVDHPHGGGEGKTSGGRHSTSPWGVLSKGYKTVSKKKRKLNKKKVVYLN